MAPRLIFPYVEGVVQPRSVDAVRTIAHELHLILREERLDPSDATHYARLLTELWAEPHDTILIEHDVLVTSLMVARMMRCGEPFCVRRAWFGNSFGVGLACVMFSGQLMADEPDLMTDMHPSLQAASWHRLDTAILGELHIRGHDPHTHDEPVIHLHPYIRPDPQLDDC